VRLFCGDDGSTGGFFEKDGEILVDESSSDADKYPKLRESTFLVACFCRVLLQKLLDKEP